MCFSSGTFLSGAGSSPGRGHCVVFLGIGTAEGEGLVGLWPCHICFWDLFSRAPDGTQMQDKWRDSDLNVCLY